MKKVTDTTKLPPELLLVEAMVRGGASGMIEAQEAQGQREAVNSDQLPTRGLLGANRPSFEAMGIKIITPGVGAEHTLPGAVTDKLFTMVELPKGWKKEPTNHAMWNNLVDDKGRVRATFFYKAAFYDREAFISPERRFEIKQNLDRDDWREVFSFQVLDCKKPVFSIEEPVPMQDNGVRNYQLAETVEKKLKKACHEWLIENGYPWYDDFSAYWE